MAQIENIRTHPSILAVMTRGALRLHAWIYEIESGDVMAFDDHAWQYVPVPEAGQGVVERSDRLSAIRQI